jgi:phage terminase large subunit GpA-like protein
MRAVVDAFECPGVETVAVVAGAQMGKTETVFNLIGKQLDEGPYQPILYIAPTEKLARSIADDRFSQMLESTPALTAKWERGQRDKAAEKWFAGVRVGFAWAGSAVELSSHPAGRAYMDELDRMGGNVAGEGDPVVLTRARLRNYYGSVLGLFSTPTIAGRSAIESWWAAGWALKLCFVCPGCGLAWFPTIDSLHWDDSVRSISGAAQSGGMHCTQCERELSERERLECIAGGVWRQFTMDDEGVHHMVEGEPELGGRIASFWLPGLASPWSTIREVLELVIKAKRSHDSDELRAITNTFLGDVYRERGVRPAWQSILGLRSPYARGELPDGAQLLTMGVDVQRDRLFYVVRGWGFNLESWLIDEGELWGDTGFDDVWLVLAQLFSRVWGGLTLSRVCIDSGYKPGARESYSPGGLDRPEHQVYLFCRRWPGLTFPTKGEPTMRKPHEFSLIRINTDFYKHWLYGRMAWPAGESGAWHVHSDITEDYARQVVAEEMIVDPRTGQRSWVCPPKRPNHYLDCEVLATAGALTIHADITLGTSLDRPPTKNAPGKPPNQPGSRFSRRPL